MITQIFNAMRAPVRLSPMVHGGGALAAVALQQGMQVILNASYAASGHPVDYKTGQLAFSAEKIEEYYGVMANQGTLDIYLRTQIIDYGFIFATALAAWVLGTALARLALGQGLVYWGGLAVAVLGVTGAGFDALENLISFVMLARPEAIADPVALIYSGFAAAKFACLMPAFTLAPIVLVMGGIVRGWSKRGRAATA